MIDRVSRELTLDDAQKQRLGVLADKLREQRLALVGSTTDPRAEFQALVTGTTFDRARAQALVESKTNAVRTKSPEVIAAMADFYDSLRPEQQQKVREFMAKRRNSWRG
jgi:Spy/CpxP family protein refolding chaperone